MGDNNAVMNNWSTLTSPAFSLHASPNGVFGDDDCFGLLLGQPLRVEGGNVDVTLPVGQRDDGSLVYGTERIGLAPSGREIGFELVYEKPVRENVTVAPFLVLRHQPGHSKNADDEAIGGNRAQWRW